MSGLLERHADLAILLILFLEDMGVPMPVPADVAMLLAGYRLRNHASPVLFIVLMVLAINIGATILYAVAYQGGRPLIDRFGHYLHLNAEKLERTESWLRRRGFWGIALGRAIPGVRIVTVLACGIFRVPPVRFLTAQFVGISLYMVVLLAAGYWVGPEAVERIRLPSLSFRLVLTVIVAVALPLVLRRLNRKTATDDTRMIEARITPRERVMADLLAGFGGMIHLSSVWFIFASLTNLMQRAEVERSALMLARWFHAANRPRAVAYTLDYLAVLVMCLVGAVIFFQVLMPRLHIGPRWLVRQTLALWSLMLLAPTVIIVINLLDHSVRRRNQVSFWLSHSGGLVLGIIALGLLGYAYVAAEVRRLAIDRLAIDPKIAPSVMEALDAPVHVEEPEPPPLKGSPTPVHEYEREYT